MPGISIPILGILTLGQSPRVDVTPTLRARIDESLRLIEAGGLDGLSTGEIAALAPDAGEAGIETRLRSGESVIVARERLEPLLVTAFARLKAECSRVLLLCSGEFPALAADCPGLIQPIGMIRAAVSALASSSVLGIVGPASDMAGSPAQWAAYAKALLCAAASPYEDESALIGAASRLAAAGAEVILLDDMAFTEGQRLVAMEASGLPVLCASTLVARMLGEFFAVRQAEEDRCPRT